MPLSSHVFLLTQQRCLLKLWTTEHTIITQLVVHAIEVLCELRGVHSPKTHETKCESPGQDKCHPEVNILHRSVLIQRVVLKSIKPDVLQAHPVLQMVAGVRSGGAEGKKKPTVGWFSLHFV